MQVVKIVIVGDDGIGKTSLAMRFNGGEFPGEPVDKADTYTKIITHRGANIQLIICDTSGNSDADNARPAIFDDADIFLLCYSVVDRSTLESVKNKWAAPDVGKLDKGVKRQGWQSVKRYCPDVPILLVGTKIDLRNYNQESNPKWVNENEGRSFAFSINAANYTEISSLNNINLNELFDSAINRVLLDTKKKHKKKIDAPISLPFNVGTVTVTCIKATGVRPADMNGLSDPYVNAGLIKSDNSFYSLKKSRIHKKTLNPVWHEDLLLELNEKNLLNTIGIRIQVWDKDFASDDFLGQVDYMWGNEKTIFKGEEETVELKEMEGKPVGVTGTITLKLKFTKK